MTFIAIARIFRLGGARGLIMIIHAPLTGRLWNAPLAIAWRAGKLVRPPTTFAITAAFRRRDF
jgi:hypothetical protein